MKNWIIILGILTWAFSSKAQEGKTFPMLIGQLVDGKAVDLPESVQGKYTLIGMSWSRKAEQAFETWVNPVYNKFIAKTGMMDGMYDINVYFIPMFVGTKKSAMQSVMNSMKAKSDPEIFPYVLFYKGDMEVYEEKLGLKDESVPYVFLLDERGTVVYKTRGRFDEDKMLEIEKILIDN